MNTMQAIRMCIQHSADLPWRLLLLDENIMVQKPYLKRSGLIQSYLETTILKSTIIMSVGMRGSLGATIRAINVFSVKGN